MSRNTSNIARAEALLTEIMSMGGSDIIVCPGARNAPLVFALEGVEGVNKYSFFDERAASFFALGRAKSHKYRGEVKPTVVITTSGTAVAELLPAVVEAHYSGLPLVVVTADRPQSFRGSGAPQSIDQVNIFGNYVSHCIDLGEGMAVTGVCGKLQSQRPLHINICFSEPLIDESREGFDKKYYDPQWGIVNSPVEWPTRGGLWEEFVDQSKRPLVIVGSLDNSERVAVKEVLSTFKGPVWLEGPSGLRAESCFSKKEITSEPFLKRLLVSEQVDGVIRIGGVPTLRVWRDLENLNIPVVSFSGLNFSGLSRASDSVVPLSHFLKVDLSGFEAAVVDSGQNQRWIKGMTQLFEMFPQSEQAMVHQFSCKLPHKTNLFLGSSLPIRHWDWFANSKDQDIHIVSNRGANGIDGTVASFLGFAEGGKENWCLLGDLSALYDLNALALAQQAASANLRVVVINNSGGQIFSRLFSHPAFLNEHPYQFEQWAKMFGWEYQKVEDIKDWPQKLEGPVVIELRPKLDQTSAFWQGYDKLSQ